MSDKNQWLKDLCGEDDLWATEFSAIPSMIKSQYDNLRRLAEDGQVYGVMLQCKDLYESLHKVPIVMVLIIMENDPEHRGSEEYASIINTSLESPMSMGQWDKLAGVIIKKGKKMELPAELIEILKRTRKLYSVDLDKNGRNVMNWRNTEVGHGALRFENDEIYQKEIRSLLKMLKVYFDGPGKYCINGLYDHVYLALDGIKLVGDTVVNQKASGEIALCVASTNYTTKYYVKRQDLRCFLFDSFYGRKRIVKYCSYTDGQNEEIRSQYFDLLYKKYVGKNHEDFELNAEVTSRKQAKILECLSAPLTYIEPEDLVDRLSEAMEDLEKGIVALFMERGTGKSAFANRMSGLYNASPLIRNSFSRCYHVRDASLKGMNDFINSLEFNYRHSFNPDDDTYAFSDKAPTLSLDTETPATDMAEYLNYYHSKYGEDYTILLIDGIDEITDRTARILDFIPPTDSLNEGVFVVLLSRFKDESTVIGSSKRFIETAENKSDKQISIRRTDQSNIDVLKACLENEIKEGRLSTDINQEDLIVKADYRFLYLKAYIGINAEILLNTADEYKFIESYMNLILSFYGPSQRNKIKEIAVSIALFPSFTIKSYHEYLSSEPITYEFIGLLNDLLPVLTVLHSDDGEYYEYADEAYSEYVLEEYKDVVEKRIGFFFMSMEDFLDSSLPDVDDLYYVADPKELKNNQAFIFYAESLVGIWNRANRNASIRSLFFDNTSIIRMVSRWCFDEWVTSGRGFYIISELLNCIYSALDYCVRNSEDAVASKWSKVIGNGMADLLYANWGREPIWISHIWESDGIRRLFNSIIHNQEAVKDIDAWFWVLATNKTEKTVELLVKKNAVNDFAGFIHNYYRALTVSKRIEDWFDILLEAEISKSYKQRIISIKNEIDEQIEKELEMMEEREQIEQENEHELISDAIKDLLNFEIPWSEIEETEQGFFLNYLLLAEYNKKREHSELMSALYKRMCFERVKGNLVELLNTVVKNYSVLLFVILHNEFTDDEMFYQNLRWWIDVIIQLVNNGSLILLSHLSVLFVEGIKWLDSKKRKTEAISMLEDYVYYVDTEAFLRTAELKTSDEVDTQIVFQEGSLLYPTSNVIYLLNQYYLEGMYEKFSCLMSKVENDIPLIEKQIRHYRIGDVICELKLFDFIWYRKSIKYSSDFDKYLNEKILAHKKAVQEELGSISRNSDFSNMELHIELLMDYAWRTNDWITGCRICDEFIDLFKENDCSDIVVKESLELEIKRIHSCKLFFSYLESGVFIEKEHDATGTPQSAYQFKTHGRTAYTAIQSLFENLKPENREEYINDAGICLEYYFFQVT